MTKEVLQQALDALESLFNFQVDPERGQRCVNAITVLKESLAQPEQPTVTCQIYGHVVGACAECNTHNEQDPVAWMTHANDTLPLFHKTLAGALGWGAEPTPLYTKPRNQNER